MSVQELIAKQTLCNKQSWAEQDQFFGGLEAPDTLGLQEALLGLAGGFNQHRKQCTTVEKSWGWTMEQPVNKHFCLLPRSGDSRDPVVAAKNNCSPVIVAVWICETALLAPNSLMSPAHCWSLSQTSQVFPNCTAVTFLPALQFERGRSIWKMCEWPRWVKTTAPPHLSSCLQVCHEQACRKDH